MRSKVKFALSHPIQTALLRAEFRAAEAECLLAYNEWASAQYLYNEQMDRWHELRMRDDVSEEYVAKYYESTVRLYLEAQQKTSYRWHLTGQRVEALEIALQERSSYRHDWPFKD